MEPASIRTKNPGAMWGRVGKKPTVFFETPQGPRGVMTNAEIPLRWGSTKTIYLADGLDQDNNIAIFDTWVDGICAQLDLWRTSPKYANKSFGAAISIWDGGNNTESYIAYVTARVPGMTRDTVMNDAFWSGPMGLAFLKAQAGHEAGVPHYPAPDADWLEAQRRVFARVPAKAAPKTTTKVAVHTGAVAAPVAAAVHAGLPIGQIIFIGAAALAAVAIGWSIWTREHT